MSRPAFSIYDASAGSGKTYALVKEYLKIILTSPKDDAYRNILAITFTNKAVHEMKSRIVGSLSEFASDDPSEKAQSLMNDISSDTALPVLEIRRKAKNIIRHIIHNYAAFDISTIDKFTHKVIRTFAHDLNLPVTFEVSLDTENLLAEAVDALIARAGDDQVLTDLLVDFTMEKTDDDKSWDVSREIIDTGRLILNENTRSEIAHFHGKTIPEFAAIKSHLLESSKKTEDENVRLAELALKLLDEKCIEPKCFSGEYFPKHLQSIKNRNFNPKNKRYFEPDDIKINKTATDRNAIESLIPELLKITATIYENFQRRDFYQAFLKNITPLSLLNTVNDELAKIQQEQNILSISQFNKLINDQIQNQPAPFIYERLGERYRHFFIDEFQDTSEMQWQNLIPLIDNATSSEDNGVKGSLMIVGDPKQSIYRWRGGKAEQFIALSKDHNPFNNPEKALFSLDTNYRSYSEVISFNNDFFRFLSGEFADVDYRDLYENKSQQKANAKTGGFVEIAFIADQDDDDDAPDKSQQYVEATLAAIEKALALGFEYHDIAVLTRKRGHGILVANYLTDNKIPIISSETLLIGNATDVRFVVHMLRYLKNSADLEAKAYILQYVGVKNQAGDLLHDFIAAGMSKNLEADFETWLAAQKIPMSFSDIRKKSLYESVELVLSKFAVGSNAYVQHFLDLVLERDIKYQAGVADFLDYWDKNSEKFSIPSPENSSAVRIMTIHKSKGLEFPVVIFPFADENYSRKPKDKLWLDSDEATFGLPRVLVDNTSSVEGFGSDASQVYQQKKQEELVDNVNVLYVAMTRAEEQLYVISAMNLSKKGEPPANCLSTFFIKYLDKLGRYNPDLHCYKFGSEQKVSAKSEMPEPLREIPAIDNILRPEAIKIAQRESLMWGTTQQEAIEYGNLIHEIMSLVKTRHDIDLALEKAVDDGLIPAGEKAAIGRTVSQIVGHPELSAFFPPSHKVFNEKDIIQKDGGVVKPDRIVFADGNLVHLLDYKTGAHKPKYVQQLANYQDSLEKMGFSVGKKALVYIGAEVNVINL